MDTDVYISPVSPPPKRAFPSFPFLVVQSCALDVNTAAAAYPHSHCKHLSLAVLIAASYNAGFRSPEFIASGAAVNHNERLCVGLPRETCVFDSSARKPLLYGSLDSVMTMAFRCRKTGNPKPCRIAIRFLNGTTGICHLRLVPRASARPPRQIDVQAFENAVT
ncbi:hypothetical protein MTO96_027477 [Rhipicephalus appendiculatus]